MDEQVSFWKKSPDELDVGDSLKYVALTPVVAVTAFVLPMYVIGRIIERKQARDAKKKAHLTVVSTDETA
jgi:hypothetical protein